MTDTEDLTVSHAPFCHIITIYLKHRLFVGAHCFMYRQSRWPVSITRTAVDFRWTLKTAPLLYSESHDSFQSIAKLKLKSQQLNLGGHGLLCPTINSRDRPESHMDSMETEPLPKQDRLNFLRHFVDPMSVVNFLHLVFIICI